MNPSDFQRPDASIFPYRPSPTLNGFRSNYRQSLPPLPTTTNATRSDSSSPKQEFAQASKTRVFKIAVVVGAVVLIAVALTVALPLIFTQMESQSGAKDPLLTANQDFETTSSLNSFGQSSSQFSPKSTQHTTKTDDVYTSAKVFLVSESSSESSTSAADLHTTESVSSFQSLKSSGQTAIMSTTLDYITSTQKLATSKSYDQSTYPNVSPSDSACRVFCRPTQSCIPPSLVCDRTQDCPDDSDEVNCTCANYQYRCTNGRCIYKSWCCDGVKDCPMGDDESSKLCGSCNSTDFRCSKPHNCILSSSQCDGIIDCLDSSDESRCIDVFNGETSNVSTIVSLLNVTFRGIPGYYICSENWNETWSDSVCVEMGQEQSSSTSYETVGAESALFVALNVSVSASNLLAHLEPANCSSKKAVAVSCRPSVCGTRSVSVGSVGQYILNGQQAKRGAWPFFAWLLQGINSPGSFSQRASCGSVLINNRWLLTAAHCNIVATTDLGYTGILKPENILISFGLITRSGSIDSMTASVDKVFVHPSYSTTPSTIFDVGLLRLSRPLNFTDTISPICLPSKDEDLARLKVCVDVGFGRTLRNEPSQNLLQARMNILSYSDCYQYLKNSFLKDSSQFCAGTLPTEGDINFCTGDSGGPLSCQDQNGIWKVLGINSYVIGQNNNEAKDSCYLSVASRVTYFLDWIQQTMAANSV